MLFRRPKLDNPSAAEGLKEKPLDREARGIVSDLGDIPLIDFGKFEPGMPQCDRDSGSQIAEYFRSATPGTVYVIGGATPHLLPAVVEADKAGLTVRGIARGKHRGGHQEKRTAEVALALGIESATEFGKLFQKPEKRGSTAIFLLEPTTHINQVPREEAYGRILPRLENTARKVVLIGEGILREDAAITEGYAREGGEPKTAFDTLANWCYRKGVSFEMHGFYPHGEEATRHMAELRGEGKAHWLNEGS